MTNKIDELKQMETFKELLEAKITGLKKELEQEEQEEKKFPQHDDKFYFIDEDGDVLYGRYDEDVTEDNRKENIGNCFRTREKAEFEIERLKVLKELKEFSKKFGLGERNYYLARFKDNEITTGSNFAMQYDVIYFESKEKVEEAIEAVGEDRIRKYYFGIGVE